VGTGKSGKYALMGDALPLSGSRATGQPGCFPGWPLGKDATHIMAFDANMLCRGKGILPSYEHKSIRGRSCHGDLASRPAPAPWPNVCLFLVIRCAGVAGDVAVSTATRIRLVGKESDGYLAKAAALALQRVCSLFSFPCGSGLSLGTISFTMRDLPLTVRQVPHVEHVCHTVPSANGRLRPPLRGWHEVCPQTLTRK
jgi:hypothetical protein